MNTLWTSETIFQTKARIEYKNRVAEHFEKVAYYLKNYYLREPWKNLDTLIIEYIDLIHMGIERDYKDFLSKYCNDFGESLVCLMNKGVEIGMNDELYTEAFDVLIRLNRYLEF